MSGMGCETMSGQSAWTEAEVHAASAALLDAPLENTIEQDVRTVLDAALRGRMVSVERAVRIDCAANGCAAPHSDDGRILQHWEDDEPLPERINNHRVASIERIVTVSPWRLADSEASGA